MVWRPRRLTRERMEERRVAAGRLLRAGRLSQAEVAREVGVSRASVARPSPHLPPRRPARSAPTLRDLSEEH